MMMMMMIMIMMMIIIDYGETIFLQKNKQTKNLLR